MKLQQHLEALQEIEWQLQSQYGNCTPIYGQHEFGRFALVVNMAFAHWSDMDAAASNVNYQDEERNAKADEAVHSLKVIKELAKELYEQEREPAPIVFSDEEQLDYDQTVMAAAGRWGY